MKQREQGGASDGTDGLGQFCLVDGAGSLAIAASPAAVSLEGRAERPCGGAGRLAMWG